MSKPLSLRAERRLFLAGGLLTAGESSGGLGYSIHQRPGEGAAQAVLRAVQGLPAETAKHFQGLVDWVEDYERTDAQEPVAPRRDPVQHPVLRDRPAPLDADPFVEVEGGWSDEDAVLQAMASVQGSNPPDGAPAVERPSQRA